MGEKTKALIALALGGLAVYFLLKAKEAKAAEKAGEPEERLPLSLITPEAKLPKIPAGWSVDFEKGIVTVPVDGKVTYDISWFIEKFPYMKHFKIEAMPYQYRNVYQ